MLSKRDRFGFAFFVLVATTSAQQAPALQITSPTNGTTVTAGQSLNVSVVLAQGIHLSQVDVFGTVPLGDAGPLSSPPFQFVFNIPTNVPYGTYHLSAAGVDAAGNLYTSNPLAISIEPISAPVTLKVQPGKLGFQFVGQQLPLFVSGVFANGTVADLTQSSATTYSSTNPQIATVTSSGLVTAVGGSGAGTSILVQRGSLTASVPVVVPTAFRGDLNGDGVVDQNDLNIITLALNTPATKPFDARDLNGDGVINALDARILVTLCSRAGCATH